MRQTSFDQMHCSIARSLDIVGDWWTPLIIRDVYLGVNRFDDLVHDLGISRNLLTSRLQTLMRSGIVNKVQYHQHPPRFEYYLTQPGIEFVPVLMALMAWGDKWLDRDDGPPIVLVDETTGKPFVPTVVNPDTGEPIDANTVRAYAGPGGRRAEGTRVLAERLPKPCDELHGSPQQIEPQRRLSEPPSA